MPRRSSILRPLALCLFLVLAACSGGEQQALAEARRRVDRGEVEQALAALGELSGPSAQELRGRIEVLRRHRGELEAQVERIFAEAPERGPNWGRVELQQLLLAQTDPVCVARVEQAQSDLPEFLIERRASHPRASGAAAGGALTEAGATSPQREWAGDSALGRARAAQRERRWADAQAEVARAQQDPAQAEDARLAEIAIRSATRVDAESVLSKVKEIERREGATAAANSLRAELARFPAGAQSQSLRFEAQLLEARVRRPGTASANGSGRRPAADPHPLSLAESADDCADLARSCEHAGDLIGARSAWLEAGRRRDEFLWRQACDARARELDYRVAMRQELADFAKVDESTARALGEQRAVGESSALPDLAAIELLQVLQLLEHASASNKARMGWTVEAIERGGQRERELALAQLGLALQRGEIDAVRASGLVARAKGELSDGGWDFRDGRWIAARAAREAGAAAAASERAAAIAKRVGQFVRSEIRERDRLFALWIEEGDPELVAASLCARAEETWQRIERVPALRQLAGLAEERRSLDAARSKALALIFDEVRYFYPYNPPACPPEKAAKYPAVQREVDVLVGEVRKLWEGARRVKPGSALRELLEDLRWTIAKAGEWHVELPDLPAESAYLLALPAGEELGLREFAWNASERHSLEQWDRIEARNERLWRELEGAKPGDALADHGEREQVRVTNAYRRLLGRGALAWNPKLQAAAQGHSDYMANSGNFGHFEEGDPARRTPMDRMSLVGYTLGAGENCSMGRGDPRSAHEGWCQSSGHHRNLLADGHREMASAIASSYWTQNFGVDSSFSADL